MTSRERLETILRGGIPDRVPATVHQWQSCHYRNIMMPSDHFFHAPKTHMEYYTEAVRETCTY